MSVIRIGRGRVHLDLPSGEHTDVYSNSMWSGYFMDWRYIGGGTPALLRKMSVSDYRVRMMFYPLAGGSIGVFVRRLDRSNFYHMYYYYDSATGTKYMRLSKMVAASETILASTTITATVLLYLEGEAVGSTLNMMWGETLPLTTVNLSAVDTTFTEPGYAGCGQWGEGIHGLSGSWVETLPPSTEVPVPRLWIEAPVTGSGRHPDDPFRPDISVPAEKTVVVVTDRARHEIAVKAGKQLGLSEAEAGLLFGTAHPMAVPEHPLPYACYAPVDRRTGKPSSDTFLVGLLEPLPSMDKLKQYSPKAKRVKNHVKWLREHGMNEEARIIKKMLRGAGK